MESQMTHQEAISKAMKLLKLSQSNNPNESAVAAAKAQEIMDRYKLGALSLDEGQMPEEEIQYFRDWTLDESGRMSSWRRKLGGMLSRHNQCRLVVGKDYFTNKSYFRIVGRPSDAEVVRYLYPWLCQEVERLARRDCKGLGHTYGLNYRLGVVETIAARLYEQRKATDAAMKAEAQGTSEFALVRIENAIVKRDKQVLAVRDWLKDHDFGRARGSRHTYDGTARAHGNAAGHEVRLTRTRGEIGS